jgi:hypothetical protein
MSVIRPPGLSHTLQETVAMTARDISHSLHVIVVAIVVVELHLAPETCKLRTFQWEFHDYESICAAVVSTTLLLTVFAKQDVCSVLQI